MSDAPNPGPLPIYDADARRHWSWRPAFLARAAIADGSELWRSRGLLRVLVGGQLRERYQESVLGFAWSLLLPLLMLGIKALLFSQVMRGGMEDYAVYLFSGLVPLGLFQGGIVAGGSSLLAAAPVFRQVRHNLLVFPLAEVLAAVVNTVFSFCAMFLLVILLADVFSPALLWLVPAMLLLSTFTIGCALIAATLVTYFRDFQHAISVVSYLMLFTTPVFYTVEMIGPYGMILKLNPLTHQIRLFQYAIYYQTTPPLQTWLLATGTAMVALAIGYTAFRWRRHDFIYRV